MYRTVESSFVAERLIAHNQLPPQSAMTSGPMGGDHSAVREYFLRKAVGVSALMWLLALWSMPLDAQMNGHNALGDFGVLSGSQPAPGFYAAAMWYSYYADQVLDRDGNPLSLLPSADPTTIRMNALVGLFWWVTDKQILGANYGIMLGPSYPFSSGRYRIGLRLTRLGRVPVGHVRRSTQAVHSSMEAHHE